MSRFKIVSNHFMENLAWCPSEFFAFEPAEACPFLFIVS
jgi:hypothetical protein